MKFCENFHLFSNSTNTQIQIINRQVAFCDLIFINDKNRSETEDFVSTINKNRIKRNINKVKIIETAIFVDQSLASKYKDHFNDLKKLIAAIMNEVQIIYNYPSMRTRIKIVIVKLEFLSSNNFPDPADGDIDNYLDNFCLWQAQKNRKQNRDKRWDHALLLTGLDLYKNLGNGRTNKKVLGLAWVNGMCKPTYSCTINEAKSFEAAFVIAHEMGHSLGILHDGIGNNCDPNKDIMSEKTGPGKINWSTCSNIYIQSFIAKGETKCLDDEAFVNEELSDFLKSDRLPGQQFNADTQCELALGERYKAYYSTKRPFDNICRELWCLSGNWASPAHPALEGSDCSKEGKKCFQGKCMIKPFSQSNDHLTTIRNTTTDNIYNARKKLRQRQNTKIPVRNIRRFQARKNKQMTAMTASKISFQPSSSFSSSLITSSESSSPSTQSSLFQEPNLMETIRSKIKSITTSVKKFLKNIFG